jgi:Peptidase family M1 domain
MKIRITLLSLLFILVPFLTSIAQEELIVPKGNAIAFEKQTRQKDGNPGINYWQNTSDYYIKASVDVENKIISGWEKITYYNNSPDSLKTIVIRLYQDLFKKGANRNSIVDVNPLDIHDGVNIISLVVNSTEIDLDKDNVQVKRVGTLMYIFLDERLAPQKKIDIEIEWDFDFPQHTLIRMGTIDSSSLFVGQWYPQIAVYDDVYGWDTRSYNGLAEFYNDFVNFDVEITVPENFMVWATGEPQNMTEVLQAKYCEIYNQASISNEIVHVITEEDLKKGDITTQNNTWKYKATNVSDFAFGVSDHYLWDVTSVVVDKTTKRRTIVGAAYNKTAPNFDKVAEIARETVRSLSEEMPGIPYPFPYITVYHGDFGMEYPMITNVGAEEDYGMTVYANSHEITHAYFPFYVGTNETKNGWLDEGLVVFMPEKVQSELAPELNIALYNTSAFSAYSGLEDEPAVITPTHYLDARIYFYLNYAKTEQALRMLQIELDEDVFKECLHAFIERWKYKHPTPLDFFNTFSDVSNQNLNWYWLAWYYQNGGIPDLAISDVEKQDNKFTISITNKGDLPIPVLIYCYNNEKLVQTIEKSASVWKNNKKEINIGFDADGTITKIIVSSDIIPDADRSDNTYIIK